jgi:hypothetical protein
MSSMLNRRRVRLRSLDDNNRRYIATRCRPCRTSRKHSAYNDQPAMYRHIRHGTGRTSTRDNADRQTWPFDPAHCRTGIIPSHHCRTKRCIGLGRGPAARCILEFCFRQQAVGLARLLGGPLDVSPGVVRTHADDRMRTLLCKTGIAPGVVATMKQCILFREIVAVPGRMPRLALAGHMKLAYGERPADRHDMLRKLVSVYIPRRSLHIFRVPPFNDHGSWRSHEERPRRHDHHLRAILALPERIPRL